MHDVEGWQNFASDPEVPPIFQEAGLEGQAQAPESSGRYEAQPAVARPSARDAISMNTFFTFGRHGFAKCRHILDALSRVATQLGGGVSKDMDTG